MKKVSSKTISKRDLRIRPERLLTDLDPEETYSGDEIRELVHELVVHQSELQAQNEELSRIQAELEESRNRYFCLYDFAPVAYLSLSRHSRVADVNQTGASMLGAERQHILGRPFWQFIFPEDRQDYFDCIERADRDETRQLCEVRIIQNGGDEKYAHMEIIPGENSKGNTMAFQVLLIDTTNRRKTEETLRESEDRFRAVFDNTLEAVILVDPEGPGKVISVNQAACSMFGYSEEEFLSLDSKSIVVMGNPSVKRIMKDLSQSGRASGAMTYKRRDGARFTGEISIAMFSDRKGKRLSVSVIRDVTDRERIEKELARYSEDLEYLVKERTIELEERNLLLQEEVSERKRYEAALRESEEKYRQLVENANEAILVAQDGMLRFVNSKFSEFTGYTVEELASIPFAELIHPEDRNMVVTRHQRRIQGDEVPLTYEFRMVDRDKNVKWLGINSIRITWQERPATLNFLTDITDWKKTEQEKEMIVDQLLQSQKMEALGRFAGGIAHDLNNILYPIVVNTETMLDDAVAGTESCQMLQEVLEAAYRQKDLVKQILSFSRRSEQKFVPIRIIPLIHETIKFIRSSLPSTIEIWNHISTRTDAVLGDSTQIHQVIMNLCKNAADALESRKGLIEISLENETVSDHPEMRKGDYLKLSVRDTGCGMGPDVLDRIFEPFFTTKGKDKGNGMGLSVVHGIIENHRGTITAKSEPGKGSEFIVHLPKYSGEILKQATLFENDALTGGRKKILLVDDEESILTSLQRALQKVGFDVVAEKDAMKALVLFNRSPEEFDIVITDLTMPRVTGVELAEKLRDTRPDILVILCTGLSDGLDEKRVKAAGIRDIIMKPANMSELRDALHRAFENR